MRLNDCQDVLFNVTANILNVLAWVDYAVSTVISDTEAAFSVCSNCLFFSLIFRTIMWDDVWQVIFGIHRLRCF